MTTKIHLLSWINYKKVTRHYDVDPYEELEFGIDLGGGDSENFICLDDPPERKES